MSGQALITILHNGSYGPDSRGLIPWMRMGRLISTLDKQNLPIGINQVGSVLYAGFSLYNSQNLNVQYGHDGNQVEIWSTQERHVEEPPMTPLD